MDENARSVIQKQGRIYIASPAVQAMEAVFDLKASDAGRRSLRDPAARGLALDGLRRFFTL